MNVFNTMECFTVAGYIFSVFWSVLGVCSVALTRQTLRDQKKDISATDRALLALVTVQVACEILGNTIVMGCAIADHAWIMNVMLGWLIS